MQPSELLASRPAHVLLVFRQNSRDGWLLDADSFGNFGLRHAGSREIKDEFFPVHDPFYRLVDILTIGKSMLFYIRMPI